MLEGPPDKSPVSEKCSNFVGKKDPVILPKEEPVVTVDPELEIEEPFVVDPVDIPDDDGFKEPEYP